MNQSKIFIEIGLPLEVHKILLAHNIMSKHASLIGLKPTPQAQANYCFSHNMIMVAVNRGLAKLCKDVNLPVILVKEYSSLEDVVKQILF